MLKERNVARFLVAPDGYGKTTLAVEYAETMFSWTHTFWVNARSPCFIRDLDAATIASDCIAYDEDVALVVFDDLPMLDPRRAEAFSREIDRLISAQCEVVVTCVPTCDMVGGLQLDRLRIDARDLLLDDAELDAVRSLDDRMRNPSGQLGAAERIPALAWGHRSEIAAFAKSILDEEMPLDLQLVVASVLVVRSGTFSDLLPMGPFDKATISEVLRDYPHLGFEEDLDRFEAPMLDVDVLASPLKARMSSLVERSSFDTPDQLTCAWAQVLVDSGHGGRACDIVREVCPRRKRAAWLVDHAQSLVSQACFFPMLRLAREQDGCKGATRVRLVAIEALCKMVLGDEEEAIRCAKRYAFDLSAPIDARVCSLLVVARLSGDVLASSLSEAIEDAASAGAGGGSVADVDWALLARAWRTGEQGAPALAQFMTECLDAQVGDVELCICASWLFGLLGGEQDLAAVSPEVRRCERYVCERLRAVSEGETDYFAASAGLSLEQARSRGVPCEGDILEAGVLIQLRKVELNILSQRRKLEEDERIARARRDDWANTHPEVLVSKAKHAIAPQAKLNVPVLSIRLFGCFEVALGDVPLEPERFGRGNARTLLALLAMHQGHDLARDSIERAMWPQSSPEVARKNYYTVWSSLRRALTLPDGTCPYLVRQRYGCRLESRYVHSDVERFGEVCREFLFGVPNVDKWSALFAEIDRDFSSDLVPAERKNRLIMQARIEYRTRLVDALVAATDGIINAGNPQWGIWFARTALDRDETREDAYVALMRAQIAGGQRTAAMATYLKCRHVLAEQLGIDPSPETTRLYESLLDGQ